LNYQSYFPLTAVQSAAQAYAIMNATNSTHRKLMDFWASQNITALDRNKLENLKIIFNQQI